MATTKRGKRILESREPQLVESGPKFTLVLKGNKSSDTVNAALKDLHRLKTTHSLLQSKRHQDLYPFDNAEGVQHLCHKWDAQLLIVGSHSKKRPDNLVFVRLFAEEILDIVEFHIQGYKAVEEFAGQSAAVGRRPILLFNGDLFETDPVFERIRNLFIDMFGGRPVEKIDSTGIEQILSVSATPERVLFLRYYSLGKSEGELVETGPRMTLSLRRHKLADDSRFLESCKRPRPKPLQKNVGKGPLGERLGRVYTNPESLSKLQLKKRRKLKDDAPETS